MGREKWRHKNYFLDSQLLFSRTAGIPHYWPPTVLWGETKSSILVLEMKIGCDGLHLRKNVLLNGCKSTNLSQLSGFQCGRSCPFCLGAIAIAFLFIPFLSLPVRWMLGFYLIPLETQVISPEGIRQRSLSGAGWLWSMKPLFLKGRCVARHGSSSLLCQCKPSRMGGKQPSGIL